MKIGLFFGSFNPVHVGHMVIANYMLEFTELDEIWFIVSPHNPLKEKRSLLAAHHRLQLVREAIGENKRMKASNIEFKLPQPSYTINTLIYLKEKYPQHNFVLLVGSDNLKSFHKWKNHEQILEQNELYVYPRSSTGGDKLSIHPNIRVVTAPLMEISSSFIREAIKNKKDVRYMMPGEVWKYIKEMHFYE